MTAPRIGDDPVAGNAIVALALIDHRLMQGRQLRGGQDRIAVRVSVDAVLPGLELRVQRSGDDLRCAGDHPVEVVG